MSYDPLERLGALACFCIVGGTIIAFVLLVQWIHG